MHEAARERFCGILKSPRPGLPMATGRRKGILCPRRRGKKGKPFCSGEPFYRAHPFDGQTSRAGQSIFVGRRRRPASTATRFTRSATASVSACALDIPFLDLSSASSVSALEGDAASRPSAPAASPASLRRLNGQRGTGPPGGPRSLRAGGGSPAVGRRRVVPAVGGPLRRAVVLIQAAHAKTGTGGAGLQTPHAGARDSSRLVPTAPPPGLAGAGTPGSWRGAGPPDGGGSGGDGAATADGSRSQDERTGPSALPRHHLGGPAGARPSTRTAGRPRNTGIAEGCGGGGGGEAGAAGVV